MNKKNLRAAGWALCLAMAVAGIGAAVGASFAQSGDAAIAAFADTDTASGSASCTDIYGTGWNRSGTGTKYADGAVRMDSTGDYFRKTDIFSGDVSAKMLTLTVTINGRINGTPTAANAYRVDAISSTGASLGYETLTGAAIYGGSNADKTFTISTGLKGCAGIKVTYQTKGAGNWAIVSVSWTATYDNSPSASGVAIARGSSSSIPGPIEEKTVTVNKGTGTIAEDLTATVTPSEAGDKSVTWSVGGTNAAYVDWEHATKGDTSLQFNFDVNAVGEFTITASANGGTDVTDVVTYYIVDPTVAKLVSVSVSGTPTKPYQNAGVAFDASGLTFTAHYDDESSKEIAAGDINWDVLVAGEKPSGTYSEAGKNAEIVIDSVTVINKVLVTTSTDKITFDDTGLPSTGDKTYTVWSDVKLNDAIYKGKTCAGRQLSSAAYERCDLRHRVHDQRRLPDFGFRRVEQQLRQRSLP